MCAPSQLQFCFFFWKPVLKVTTSGTHWSFSNLKVLKLPNKNWPNRTQKSWNDACTSSRSIGSTQETLETERSAGDEGEKSCFCRWWRRNMEKHSVFLLVFMCLLVSENFDTCRTCWQSAREIWTENQLAARLLTIKQFITNAVASMWNQFLHPTESISFKCVLFHGVCFPKTTPAMTHLDTIQATFYDFPMKWIHFINSRLIISRPAMFVYHITIPGILYRFYRELPIHVHICWWNEILIASLWVNYNISLTWIEAIWDDSSY